MHALKNLVLLLNLLLDRSHLVLPAGLLIPAKEAHVRSAKVHQPALGVHVLLCKSYKTLEHSIKIIGPQPV